MKKRIIFLLLFVLILFNLSAQFSISDTEKIPEVKISLKFDESELVANSTFTVYASYQIPKEYHMFLNEKLFNIFIKNSAFEGDQTYYPLEEADDLLGIPAFSGTVNIVRKFNISSDFNAETENLEIIAAYQICENDGTCLLPSSETFSISNQEESLTGIFTILKFIVMAFIGGLILNAMPCVLPLLSVKALNLVEQSHHEKSTIIKSALLYALGILVSFLTLAGIVISLKNSGELFGWGFQFQNPYFVFILITVIFIFSLSLFDVFTLNAPQQSMNKASEYSAGKSYSGSFLTGIFAVLVATPCTAPFMGAALGFAFSQPPLIIILIFSSLSIGFALPFVILGLFPSLIKKLPKPGNWMNTFKDIMGFLLLGTAVYLLTSLYGLIGSSIKGVLWFLLFTAFSTWIYGKFGSVIEKRIKRVLSLTIAIIIIALSAYNFIDLSIEDQNISLKDGIWESFSTELVDKYRRNNEAVFIDFYADWCTSCKVNDAAVLNKQEIIDLFKEKGVHLLKGDFTAGDNEIARWLSEYKRAGVPLYLLFRPGEDAVLFPEFLTRSMIRDEVNKIRP